MRLSMPQGSAAMRPSVFMWETSRGIGFVPEVAVDITDEFETKVKALECHKSQFPWMSEFGNNRFTESMRIRAAFYGLRYDCKYAEVFRAWRFCSYMPNFKLLP